MVTIWRKEKGSGNEKDAVHLTELDGSSPFGEKGRCRLAIDGYAGDGSTVRDDVFVGDFFLLFFSI